MSDIAFIYPPGYPKPIPLKDLGDATPQATVCRIIRECQLGTRDILMVEFGGETIMLSKEAILASTFRIKRKADDTQPGHGQP